MWGTEKRNRKQKFHFVLFLQVLIAVGSRDDYQWGLQEVILPCFPERLQYKKLMDRLPRRYFLNPFCFRQSYTQMLIFRQRYYFYGEFHSLYGHPIPVFNNCHEILPYSIRSFFSPCSAPLLCCLFSSVTSITLLEYRNSLLIELYHLINTILIHSSEKNIQKNNYP